jgi:DNA modification methylase
MEITFTSIETITPYCAECAQDPRAGNRKGGGIDSGVRLEAAGGGRSRRRDRLRAIHAWLAARKLGLTKIPVHTADNLTPAQVRAYRLMDNRSHQETDWDFELLGSELLELRDLDMDLGLTGFDTREIDAMLVAAEEDGCADFAPELPTHAVTLPGDLWTCGRHHVLCGDATSQEDVARLFGDAKPFLMVTDPPYGVEYDPRWRERAGLGRQRQVGAVVNDGRADWSAAYQLFPGDVAYVWHAGVHAVEVAQSLATAEFQIRAQIIWAKQHFALSRGNYHWQHEPCWYGVRQGRNANWRGDRTQSTLWQIANLNSFGGNRDETATGHGTQKPVELMRRPILNHSEPGDAVYDAFLGSGSTVDRRRADGACLLRTRDRSPVCGRDRIAMAAVQRHASDARRDQR